MPVHVPSERSPAQVLISPARPALIVGSVAGENPTYLVFRYLQPVGRIIMLMAPK